MPDQTLSLLSSLPGTVRIGPVRAVPAQLQAFGVEPRQVLSEVGLSPQVFASPDNRIPYTTLGQLFDACVRHTGCGHFGLLVGERFELGCLGILGEQMRNAPSVGVALSSLIRHLQVQDRGAAPMLIEVSPSLSLLGYGVYHHNLALTKPIHDAAMAMAYRLLRELCGTTWQPHLVQFNCALPEDVQVWRRLFGCTPYFDREPPGVLFDSSWLQHSIADADPRLYARADASLEKALSGMGLGERVERILLHLLPSGQASAASVAFELGISERSLRRHLEAEGCKLQQLISQTRYEMARQLLRSTRLPITAIAAALQYEDVTAFSRAFKHRSGVSPLRWRRLQ